MKSRKHIKIVLKDMFLYGFVGASTQMANLLLLPLLTRVFTTKEYGTIDLVFISTTLASTFMTLCVPSTLIRFFHEKQGKDRLVLVSTVFWFVCGISLITGILFTSATSLVLKKTGFHPMYTTYFQLGWIYAVISAILAIVSTLLRAQREIKKFGFVNLIQLILYFGFSIFLVTFVRRDVTSILYAAVLSAFIALCCGLFFTRQWISRTFSWPVLRQSLTYSLPLMPALLTNWGNQRGTRYIITIYLTLSEVGIYSVAFLISGSISFIITSFQNAWVPYVMTLKEESALVETNRKLLTLYLGGAVIVATALITVSREICVLFIGAQFLNVLPLLPWLVGGIILHGAGNITGIGVTLSNRTIINSIAAGSGVLTNICLSFILIPVLGLRGCAIGFFTAELVYVSFLTYQSYRLHPLRFQHKKAFLLVGIYIIITPFLSTLARREDFYSLVFRYLTGALLILIIGAYVRIWPVLIGYLKRRWLVRTEADANP